MQNYKSHKRFVPLYHFVTFGLVLAGLGCAIWAAITCRSENLALNFFAVFTGLAMVLIFFFARMFALRAQDRAIRAEENLRYFMLAGKRLDPKVRMSQLIALRFASDAEFVALADRAVAEDLRADAIKAAIKDWRADNHRA